MGVFLLGCACLLWPCSTHAQAAAGPAPLSQQVESWLSAGIEPGDMHERVLALGPAGERALQQVFERETATRFVRLRALSMLQAFESEAAALYFAALVHAAGTPDASLGELHPARSSLVLRRALEGLRDSGHLLGARLSAGDVIACLAHDDAHVRKAAAEVAATLEPGPTETGTVDHALHRQRVSERSRMVRASVERALSVRATGRASRASQPR